MKTKVTERFTFEAAHRLEGIGAGNSNIHGHSHEVFVTLTGEPDPDYGWVVEQSKFKGIVQPVIDRLDHRYLNEILKQTTAEGIALYLFEEIKNNITFNEINLMSVKVCKVGMCAEVNG